MDNVVKTSNRVDMACGQWELDSDRLPVCSECGEVAPQRLFYSIDKHIYDVRFVFSKYCPECGARLANKLPAITEDI